MPNIYIIMGPAGCGKSSIASEMAARAHWSMIEGDDHHPAANVEKQRNRIPLTDADRASWLDSLIRAINKISDGDIVLACSALTPYVQNRLRDETDHQCVWILIDVPPGVLMQRMSARTEHFMPVELLENQLSTLQAPADAIVVRGDQPIAAICDEILRVT